MNAFHEAIDSANMHMYSSLVCCSILCQGFMRGVREGISQLAYPLGMGERWGESKSCFVRRENSGESQSNSSVQSCFLINSNLGIWRDISIFEIILKEGRGSLYFPEPRRDGYVLS